MLGRDGAEARYMALLQVPGSKMVKNRVLYRVIGRCCKNFGNFSQNRGKNIVNSIVGRIPPGRGYQLMPLFKAGKGPFWGYFSGLG